jgi:light-regulated signal transduction histidine kinase (bacteriophytochrome)
MASAETDPGRSRTILNDAIKTLNANVLDRPVLTRTLLAAVRTRLRSRNVQYRVAEELHRRKEAEASLISANKELESFSYSVAHDLRNPLGGINGFVDLLIEDCSRQLDEECREYLYRIKSGLERMRSIIEDMLALAKISRQEIDITSVDLSGLAHLAIRELAAANPDRKVEVKIQNGIRVRADARLMSITLGNLLGNAWKYTSKVEHSYIEFGSFEQDGYRIYYVKDNGTGFDMSQAGKLFVPFQRLHVEKDFAGTGIGLAIVERAIQRHGGRIWAEGEVGKGATFFFVLTVKKRM